MCTHQDRVYYTKSPVSHLFHSKNDSHSDTSIASYDRFYHHYRKRDTNIFTCRCIVIITSICLNIYSFIVELYRCLILVIAVCDEGLSLYYCDYFIFAIGQWIIISLVRVLLYGVCSTYVSDLFSRCSPN